MFWKKKTTQGKNDPATHVLPKGEKIVAIDDHHVYTIANIITEEQRQWLDASTLWFEQGKAVFMHYYQEGLLEKRNDPEWENQAIFFWYANEQFPKKSLPPFFESFTKHYFTFIKTDLGDISLIDGQVIPWFDQPGGGRKHYCEKGGHKLTIAELFQMNLIEFLEIVEPPKITFQMLQDRDNFYFLAPDSLDFIEGWPAINGKIFPVSLVYEVGLCKLVRRI